MKPIRVRFAPSPTGGLHLGGVRTVLYNFLFARKHKGTFVLRIEDTDQNRFVPGAEEYIFQCLAWCGLTPDESVLNPQNFGPYRQSERKSLYSQYAHQLVKDGYAYYAFDTPEEIEHMRSAYKPDDYSAAQYDHRTRLKMKNSLTLEEHVVAQYLSEGKPYVVRIKMPEQETISFTDMIRGEVTFDCHQVDDKVLLKADGMPTYHLAVVVDDYLMQITHAFRGEEWLPSAPVHLLLWKYLGWETEMPQWAHLPLILKPDGHGKLSKRDGDRLGFPVFAMNWTDPKTGETAIGFKEKGFLPQAFVNMLALLGWNPGTQQEIMSMEEMVEAFTMERVHKSGAKFDYDKAKWFNHQYIQMMDNATLLQEVMPFFVNNKLGRSEEEIIKIIGLVKERCYLLTDFWEQSSYFFVTPKDIDTTALFSKWNEKLQHFFQALVQAVHHCDDWSATTFEQCFNDTLALANVKKGEALLPLRIMLVGGKFGPAVFSIAEIIGQQETLARINHALSLA